MIRSLLAAAAALLLAPTAAAAPPSLAVSADVPRGLAPLAVTLTAQTDAVAVRWELGDGTVAEGAAVRHVYPAAGAVPRSTGGAEAGPPALPYAAHL